MARITRDRAAPWPTGSVFALDGSIVPAPVSLSLSDIGWALGPVVGYNMQLGGFVLGFEGDIGWGNLSKAAQVSPLVDTNGCSNQRVLFRQERHRVVWFTTRSLSRLS